MINPKVITAFPKDIKVIEHTEIPLSDGCKLAAKIWLPDDAEDHPVPAILEYIPYRKRDFTAARDAITHPYFAGHGYACVRVDLRGSGDSQGVLKDEYLQQELDDGLEVIQWIANQQWCSGSVGMIGISWGGFNGLQIAAFNPDPLKAVISIASSDDRYADDVHYMGGCLLTDNLSWASTMFAYNSCPPDPGLVGDQWKDMWLERLKGSGLWLDTWLRHQTRDGFWKHGSVCEDYSAIQCPVMAVSGWSDGYTNAVFRLLENLNVPRKGLIGAWGHQYPHMANIKQGMGFLQYCLRWWDQYLKGIETGIEKEPMLTAWMEECVSPHVHENRPGRWVAEPSWPSPDINSKRYTLVHDHIIEGEYEDYKVEAQSVQSPLSVGLFAGKWCSYSEDTDLPSDQREEDGGALVFDSDPLQERLEILGAPTVDLAFEVNQPVAQLAVRLSDIAPDGKATRVTYGLLNLTHRNSNEEPEYLEPFQHYRVQIMLNDIAHAFPEGNKFRVAVSTSYWPLAWPPPEPVCCWIYAGKSYLDLPIRPIKSNYDSKLPQFQESEGAEPLETEMIQPPERDWAVTHNLANNESTLRVLKDAGFYRLPHANNLEIQKKVTEKYSYRYSDVNTVKGETKSYRTFKRGDWEVQTVTRTRLTSSPTHFYVNADLDAYEGERRIYSDSWDTSIKRNKV